MIRRIEACFIGELNETCNMHFSIHARFLFGALRAVVLGYFTMF